MKEMKVKVKNWSVEIDADGNRKITGQYQILAGTKVMATQGFNSSYGSVEIALPSDLIIQADELSKKIEKAISDHFDIEAVSV